jgi:predicted dehydrogenase
MKRKLKMGMVGGGKDAFIGAIHRRAALMDGQIELACGCFNRNSAKSLVSGKHLYLPDHRIYGSYKEMFEREAQLSEGERMDFVSVVTPNVAHFEPAWMALDNGYHVVVDKPLTYTLEEAYKLKKKVEETGLILAVTYTYSGYPAVKEARERVRRGDLGTIRKIYVEYPQGWLADRTEDTGNKQASWRTDPDQAGKSNCMGDIGTHCLHLAEYITSLKATEICADLHAFVPGRQLDDDGAALLRFDNGARGVLMASQIAVGEENALKIRVYGEKGGMEWVQQEPNSLILKWNDRPLEIVRTGLGYMSDMAKHNTRTPAGHPEGYIEAFANIYRNFAMTVGARTEGGQAKPEWLDFPGIDDGVHGMQFIEAIVASGYDKQQKWHKI